MAWFSFFGIVVALVVIIVGTLRGHSLILVSTIAALVCAITGAIATVAMPVFMCTMAGNDKMDYQLRLLLRFNKLYHQGARSRAYYVDN